MQKIRLIETVIYYISYIFNQNSVRTLSLTVTEKSKFLFNYSLILNENKLRAGYLFILCSYCVCFALEPLCGHPFIKFLSPQTILYYKLFFILFKYFYLIKTITSYHVDFFRFILIFMLLARFD